MSERPRHPSLDTEQGPRRAPRASKAAEQYARNSPCYPKPFGIAEAASIKGLAGGTATPEQQRRAIQWIITVLCDTYGMSYRPGENGRRDTDFAEGARNVGLQIVHLINLDLTKLKDGEPREQS